MRNSNQLKGCGVALVTPFSNQKVDFKALEKLINHTIAGGVDFLVCLGTTGESVTLDKGEKNELIAETIRLIQGRVPLVLGMGSNDTRALCKEIEKQSWSGIDAILSVSPAYNKPTQEGIYQHYMAVAEVSPLPLIIYNVPGRTSSNLSAATTLRLAESSEKFISVKEASGNIAQCMDILHSKPNDFVLLSGDDNLTLPLLAVGAEGVISVVANAYPSIFAKMVHLAQKQEMEEARNLHFQLLKLTDLLFVEGNPGGIKASLEILGICSTETRLPLVPVSLNTYKSIEQAMKLISIS
jgi:4-hydroxy-tetrahydrodipicolinate synthase